MKNKFAVISTWVLSALLAFAMIGSGQMKVRQMPMMVEHLGAWGFSPKIVFLIGAAEILGAIGLFVPRVNGLAALCLSILMFGAAGTHVVHGDAANMGVPLILAVIAGIIAYARRDSLKALLPAGSKQQTA